MRTGRYVVREPRQLGVVLARLRTVSGVTQDEMARRIGVHRAYLSRVENGLATEHLTRLFALLRELGYEISVEPSGSRG